MTDAASIPEIEAELNEYREQLTELRELQSQGDAGDASEIQSLIKDLEEAVALSEEYLEAARQREQQHQQLKTLQATANATDATITADTKNTWTPSIEAVISEAPPVKAPAVLGEEVKKQLRERQQRSALEGKAEIAWAIGANVREGDKHHSRREGVVRGVSKAGKLIVTFLEGGEAELETTDLMYLDDAQRQKDGLEAMRESLAGVGTKLPEQTENNGVAKLTADDKKRKTGASNGHIDGKPTKKTAKTTQVDKATSSWQNFKAGKKVSKKMTTGKVRKEVK